MNQNDPVVIVSAARTPIGHFQGYFTEVSTTHLGAAAIKAAIDRCHLNYNKIDEVLMGCVLPAGLGQAPARQAALYAGLPQNVNCSTINKMCGSGMKTVMLAHDAIYAGSQQIIVAGGMENMSRAPYLLPNARFGYRLGKGEILDHMMLDGLEDAYEKNHAMGYFAEKCAQKYNISREEQDNFAQTSFERAKKTTDQNLFKAEITPVIVKDRKGNEIEYQVDEGPVKLNPDKIPKLKPAFVKDGTVTAANSSSISDGAAALILMRRSTAKANGLQALATIIGHYAHAQAPEWFTTAPVSAISGLLKKINWRQDDVDLYEINEAFAVVALMAIRELQLAPEKVNIHGGACVLGHPIGASGARILVTLLYAMQQNDAKRGIAALCIGGGEATAIAIERH